MLDRISRLMSLMLAFSMVMAKWTRFPLHDALSSSSNGRQLGSHALLADALGRTLCLVAVCTMPLIPCHRRHSSISPQRFLRSGIYRLRGGESLDKHSDLSLFDLTLVAEEEAGQACERQLEEQREDGEEQKEGSTKASLPMFDDSDIIVLGSDEVLLP
eukprot:754142-Hanusia_phi.AAC.3